MTGSTIRLVGPLSVWFFENKYVEIKIYDFMKL